ncbi:hypothetical protein Droror1_Dr00026775 [Drosera rotundifolia]
MELSNLLAEMVQHGLLRGIVATNALELVIDVGHIDLTLHLYFPGTVASLWKQAGRSGRRGKPSPAVYVAFEGPLDQYFMRFPQKLFRSPIERCLIDAQNKQVLEQNLICAALEHPLSLIYDKKFIGSCLNSAIKALESRGYLSCDSSHGSAHTWSYIGQELLSYLLWLVTFWHTSITFGKIGLLFRNQKTNLSDHIDLKEMLRGAEALCISAGEDGKACIPPTITPSG